MHSLHQWVYICYLERCKTHVKAYALRWCTIYLYICTLTCPCTVMLIYLLRTSVQEFTFSLQLVPLPVVCAISCWLCGSSTNTCNFICVDICLSCYVHRRHLSSVFPALRCYTESVSPVHPDLPWYTESVGKKLVLVTMVFLFCSACIYTWITITKQAIIKKLNNGYERRVSPIQNRLQ